MERFLRELCSLCLTRTPSAVRHHAIFGVCNLMGVNMQPTSGEVGGLKRVHLYFHMAAAAAAADASQGRPGRGVGRERRRTR